MKMTTLSSLMLMAFGCLAQETNLIKPSFVKGTMEIRYNSRTDTAGGQPRAGVKDIYTLNLNVSDSALFRGRIEQTPIIAATFDRIIQPAALNYQLDCSVVNPNNPAQSKQVGRMYGLVPISPQGVYGYGAGTLKIAINAMGEAKEFESRFLGTASGKPLRKSWIEQRKQDVIRVTKQIKGKTMAISVKKYDKMTFTDMKIGSGPVRAYPVATVNGTMLYDGDRYAWYFHGVTIAYVVGGETKVDKISGNILWKESPTRKSDGLGEYEFDVRVNEPEATESAAFAPAADEASFFASDSNIPALTGTMKYKDSMAGETVTASNITIDLKGNKINRQQTMNLTKMILLAAIVPMNTE